MRAASWVGCGVEGVQAAREEIHPYTVALNVAIGKSNQVAMTIGRCAGVAYALPGIELVLHHAHRGDGVRRCELAFAGFLDRGGNG